MSFWASVNGLELREFRPGVRSVAELGQGLNMVCMEIGPGLEDMGHEHPFEQCGIVTEGSMEMFIGDERRLLGPLDAYFIPAGVRHGWKTFAAPVKVLDISGKPPQACSRPPGKRRGGAGAHASPLSRAAHAPAGPVPSLLPFP